jgi:DNA polymerase sigma
VGSSNSRFKAEVVKALAEVDFRFAQMLRVIKVWSAAHGLNDASNGTFNTFALSLMVRLLWHPAFLNLKWHLPPFWQ